MANLKPVVKFSERHRYMLTLTKVERAVYEAYCKRASNEELERIVQHHTGCSNIPYFESYLASMITTINRKINGAVF